MRRFKLLEPSFGPPPKITRRVAALVALITICYACLAFVYMGSFDLPQTYLTTQKDYENFYFKFDEPTVLGQAYLYKRFGTSRMKVYGGHSEYGPWKELLDCELEQHHQWVHYSCAEDEPYEYAKVEIKNKDVEIAEFCIIDREDNSVANITPISVERSGDLESAKRLAALVDEQSTIDRTSTPMTFAYFDEFLYNETTYRLMQGGDQYLPEITHPPLGKDIMMIGIGLFGMTSFGWRFTGTIVGILMVPVMFLLARRVLRNNNWAILATLLLSVEFMHFTQTRMATIDSYPLLFIMCSYIFILRYFTSETRRGEIFSLLWCGIFFGLSVASKWIGLYSGAGLAICFFYFLACKVHARRKQSVTKPDGSSARLRSGKYVVATLLLCVIFFIIIPAGIYFASYIPFMNMDYAEYTGVEGMLNNQVHMLTFHEGVNDEFTFTAPWWSWPLVLKPINLYNCNVSNGTGSRILTMGNLLIWWSSVPAIIWAFILWLRGKRVAGDVYLELNRKKYPFQALPAPKPVVRPDAGIFTLIVAYLCQYVPWMFITRPLFIYHYFASATLSIIAIVYVLKYIAQRFRRGIIVARVYTITASALFVMFFPVISGLYMPMWYFDLMRWMPWPM